MSLATLGDYRTRHGEPRDSQQTTALLADAESLVREATGLTISKVTDDVVTLDGNGTRRLYLPEIPVTGVSLVRLDGVDLDPTEYSWWSSGALDHRHGCWWHHRPRLVEVTYTHGLDPVPGWITSLVCAMVQRALLPQVSAGVASETTGSQSVSFLAATGGVSLWLTEDEARRLRSLQGPLVA